MVTHTEAKDEMRTVFYDQLTAEAAAIVGYVPEVRWCSKEYPTKPDIEKMYIEDEFAVAESPQKAFAICSGNKKLWQTQGLVTFKIYAPQHQSNAKERSELLAEKLRQAFRAPRLNSSVWFRNARIHDMYPEKGYIRTYLTIEFSYTEVE